MKIQDISRDLSKIKKYVHTLEDENLKLKGELARQILGDAGVEIAAGEVITDETTGEGIANLTRLYERGFHICSLNFGSRRGDQCLFCAALLRRPEGD
ncbi:DNA replication intiation control protein YabA [Desulfocucumis palustris]|uniref:DNA replication intiation control protein YabA n=2 Tax=Desulfocucumis palustris TaxID=1898651 RepID=A0A2L2XDE6_9FIRM|nr:DNA replication intiation control protein YabA [Desulfocucumis palustris]